jgi:hypothetical protein
MWIELFPASAGKGSAAAWLAGMLQVSPERSLAVGNDYNDLDMLQWAGHSLVMEDSPPGLRRRFPTATCAWEALSRWRDGW